jgi:hypothetical protein
MLSWAVMIGAVPLAASLFYLLAYAGEPQSAWLWCRVLSLC